MRSPNEGKGYYPHIEKIDLLLRKGVFPYDYFDSFEKCKDSCLPPISKFYNELNEEAISVEDYNHACRVFNQFNLSNLGEYCDLYVKTDVLLLTDLFENFRKICIQTYKLDPCWYFTTPALSWDAMLLKTKVAIELFTDYDMLLFIENGVRGGISQCCNRYAIANNKYMSNFNPDDEIKYLMYLDANNLYGYAMSKYLPLKDFVWSDNNLTTQDILNLSDESDVGYILEVDLDYPPDLHDKHSDFPLAPENKPPPNCKEPRLLTTLEPKTKYVLHYSNLKLYLKLGLILKKIHRVLKFFQSPWLKNYIDYNTKLRTKAVNDFQKDFYKLMNNSIFGKTMENVRRRVDIRLCSTEEQARKLIAKSNFNRRTIFSENLMAVHLKKTNIKFFKPIHVGMTILDLSKVLMYSFHYEYMKHRYDSKIKLMYTDTDSFIYEIKTDDFYSDMKDDLNLYDTSDYDKNNVYNLPLVNKKVIGKMKDENEGNIMTEYVGLKSKMYAYKTNNKIEKRLKGIKKQTLKNKITFEDYKDCLLNQKLKYVDMNLIRSKFHSIQSIKQNKLALSYKDDKRFVNGDGITTLAHGHWSLMHLDLFNEHHHLVESRSDKLRQVKSSPIHADYEYTTSHGFENQNQNCSRRKTTQLDLHLRSLFRLPPPAKQLNSTSACAACKTTQLDHRLRSLLRLPPPAKQLNSTSACSACSACKTTQLDLRLRSLLHLRSLQNNSTRPPPAQPAPPALPASTCAACAAFCRRIGFSYLLLF
ncbi:uncharacterized protein NPIL_131301 [Nephila pilipes]|uniref:DNA-directed DNA polymerase n=1 Tax=Nephila pilipes TaxID=299642 RepID=A0A8X6PUH0_NEPPI|nr:uncharacterized protein NPIL_131301 [Nephila pilipes]